MPTPSPWTAERINLMRKIYRNGSFGWLARELNRLTGSQFTRGAIAGQLSRLGLIAPTKPKPNKITMPRTYQNASTATDPAPEDEEFLGISLIDLEFDSCRYPHGERSPFTFCGQKTIDGQSYCAKHHRLTHVASQPMRRLNW